MPFFAPVLILMAIGWRDSTHGPSMREWAGDGWVAVLSGFALLWPVVAGWPAHLWAARAMDRRGSLGAATVSHRIQSLQGVLVACGGVCSIVLFGLLDSVRAAAGNLVVIDEVVAGAVCAFAWVLVLVQVYPIERRLWDAGAVGRLDSGRRMAGHPSLARWVWLRLRESVLPVGVPGAIVLGWWEASAPVIVWLNGLAPGLGLIERGASGTTGLSVGGSAVVYAGVAVLAAIAPRLMAVSLPTVRLKEGEVYDEVRRVCGLAHVRVPAVYIWLPTRGFANAAVMGALPFGRALLLTESLVSALPREELGAVIAHEAGHMRRSHVLWLVGTVMACLLCFDAAAVVWDARLGLGATLLGVGVAFGVTSQWFERQADAFAAGVVGDGRPVATTLYRVASINGSRPGRWTITHGSIRDRAERLLNGRRPFGSGAIGYGCFRLAVVGAIIGSAWVLATRSGG